MQKRIIDPIFFWAALAPLFVTFALSAFLLQKHAALWPFVLLAPIGLFLSWRWQRRGLSSALALLCAFLFYKPIVDLWHFFFVASLGVSWAIALLSRREILLFVGKEEAAFLKTVHALNIQLSQAQEIGDAGRVSQLVLEESVKVLQQELIAARSLQTAPINNSIVDEEALPPSLELQIQCRQLREQCDEKTEVLNTLRKELFRQEHDRLLLEKQWEEAQMEASEEAVRFEAHVQRLEAERLGLESQVVQLEEVVTSLLSVKTRSRATSSKKKAPLPRMLKKVREKKQAVDQFSLLDNPAETI